MMVYLWSVTFLIGVLWIYFYVSNRNTDHPAYTRYLLIGGVLLSFVAPWIAMLIRTHFPQADGIFTFQLPELVVGAQGIPESTQSSELPSMAIMIYLVGVIFFAGRWSWSAYRIYERYWSIHPVRLGGIKIFSDPSVQIPFAFFKRIYLPEGMGPDSPDGSLAIAHEKAHIEGRHHLDNLIMILARIVLWFHPALPALHKKLRLAHELEVDSRVIQQSDPYDYASLLVKYSSGSTRFQWVSPFAQSVTEKRLHMILTQSNVMKRPAKLLFGLALLTGLAWFTSCQDNTVDTLSEDLTESSKVELPSKGAAMPENGDDQVYRVVEQMPLFPGCQDQQLAGEEMTQCAQRKMLDFIYENLKYPEDAKEEGIEGTTVVQFVVDKDGYTRDFTLARGIHPSCDEESLRVLRLMKDNAIRWEPGIQNGKKVHVQMTLPIRYALQ